MLYSLLKPVLAKIPGPKSSFGQNLWFVVRVVCFFQLVCVGWLMFRAESMEQMMQMLHSIVFNFYIVRKIGLFGLAICIIVYAVLMLIIEIAQFVKKDRFVIYKFPTWLSCALYVLLYILIIMNASANVRNFMYVQF
jgi:hypothetical protein